ncbi:calcium-binding and coiled-coil domain-containing protein 2 [Rhineura floridana]|uniref:calcium-binding and coiled-coil domain-containing protein 2 n=1 Tax=Rhineura floridana TaxID=261503 RepID=UPI002AC828E1|nr:calcium-binding and coiled-coil domain-containing protein 2 [Rhineura floridana]XP_061446562.1 calcium-binding and coiled-coil domain-containing protein 2 [Rhineura floridana]XP_061446563.1 calcium-binding and coiled-coil domain-containing protein 2 [Rhineura floridana]XP_061446564.1 calcium-binding and coiled-coil domain-containing protein 2 [Rhineura floridana]
MEAVSCNNSDEPPTSAILLDNRIFNQVIFTNIEKYYVPGADITCHYNLSQHITPRKKDWVGIFRVGWKTAREYYTFVWAPLPSNPDSGEDELQEVLFKAYYLPKDDEYYQFCYVDQDGLVRGASVPFQFHVEAEDDMLVVTTQGEVEEIEQQNTALLQENQKLKENLVSLQKQNEDLQEKLKAAEEKAKQLEDEVHLLQTGTMELQRAQNLQALEMAEVTENNMKLQKENEDLQRNLDTLRSSNEKLNLEVNLLKKKFAPLERQNSSIETELSEVKEQNKKVLSEKEELEKKLRTSLSCVDQLQQNLEKKLEEKTLSLQTLQKEKDEIEKENQRLRRENEELMAHLPEIIDNIPDGVLTQSPENPVLVYGNPYSANPAIPETDLVSMRKCPMCNEVFPNDIGEQHYSDHVQSHLLECPYCDKSFDKSNKQVYDDHVFCHGLD